MIAETLRACEDVDEWLAAVRLYPEAMGVTSAEHVSEIDVQAACGEPRYAGTPVCADARERGLVD